MGGEPTQSLAESERVRSGGIARPDYDPGRGGYSLTNVGEILFSLLEVVAARSVVEIGAFRGELTEGLLDWAASSGARVAAVDPEPPPELVTLSGRRSELELVRETSHEALRRIAIPDAVIIDGDHNYYTVSGELRLIHEKASAGAAARRGAGVFRPWRPVARRRAVGPRRRRDRGAPGPKGPPYDSTRRSGSQRSLLRFVSERRPSRIRRRAVGCRRPALPRVCLRSAHCLPTRQAPSTSARRVSLTAASG